MLSDYKDINNSEETSIALSSATVNDPTEQTTQEFVEEQKDSEEEQFFWFEPGICG